MKVIYSYKILNKYWKRHSEDFFTLAKLSSSLSRKFYKTTLYTDKYTADIFAKKGILFDEVILLESLKQVTENNYGLAKILAMQEQRDPYIIIDLDTLLFEPVDTCSSITYGYNEVSPDTLVGNKYIYEKYIKFHSLFKDSLPLDLYKIDWTIFPNNSLVAVNKPELVTHIYNDILRILDKRYLETSVQIYEQKLLYDYLKDYGVDIKFIYKRPPVLEMQVMDYRLEEIVAKKFIHLDFYFRKKGSKDLIKKISNFYKIKL